MSLHDSEVKAQSESAFRQWESLWREHASQNGETHKARGVGLRHIAGDGLGEQIVLVGAGYSVERDMGVLQQYRPPIACVDKMLGPLIDSGLRDCVRYVFISDAVVSFEAYCEPYADQTGDMVLVSNVCANPKWSQAWAGPVVFTLNKDNIQSEKIFGPISGVTDMVPAPSNVGNALVSVLCGHTKFDRYLLTGFDFAWNARKNYYAFNDSDKRYWMRRATGLGRDGEICYTSANLMFSAKWLGDFISRVIPATSRAKVYNCSGAGLLAAPEIRLGTALKTWTDREPTQREIDMVRNARAIQSRIVFNDLEKAISSLRELAETAEIFALDAYST